MPIWNDHWYIANQQRAYPIAETGTLLSDDGQALPHGIIVDALLRFPESLGNWLFLSSISISTRLISLTFQAAATLDAPTVLLPAAVLTLPKPVDVFRILALQSQYPGVAGYLVFGEQANNLDSFYARFSSPRQSVLIPKASRRYRDPPIRSIGVPESGIGLTGLVRLIGRSPLEIVKESREIDGIVRDAVVVRLVQPATQSANIFQQFAGTCGGRPESGTCGLPAVEFINNVSPDCSGVLTLQFNGAIEVAKTTPVVGIVVDGVYGIAETCTDKLRLPSNTGQLPNQYDNACDVLTISEQPETGPNTPWPPTQAHGNATLPYTDDFNACQARNFTVIHGDWVFTAGDSPAELLSSPPNGPSHCGTFGIGSSASYSTESQFGASGRNISVWTGDPTTLGRKIITDFMIKHGPVGAAHNAGVVINYRPHPTAVNRYVYYLAQVDLDISKLQLFFFNGFQPVLIGSVDLPVLQIENWYRLIVLTSAGTGNDADLHLQLQSLSDSSVNVTLGNIAAVNYLPATGYNGLEATRSYTKFSFWHVESH